MVNETNKLLKAKAPGLKKSLALYLANEETEHILFRPCRVSSIVYYYIFKLLADLLSQLKDLWAPLAC